MKDLPDLALLATAQPLEFARVRAALEQTFGFRRTHDLPGMLPAPQPAWAAPYVAEDGALWNPETWAWARGYAGG